MGSMHRLLPLPALYSHTPHLPVVDALFHDRMVTQDVVFTEEEEGRRCDRAVLENHDAVFVEVCRVSLEEPEIKHGCIFDKALKTRQQSLAKP